MNILHVLKIYILIIIAQNTTKNNSKSFLSIDSSSPRSSKSADGGQEENCATLPSPSGLPKPSTALRRLRLENEKLQAELTRLRRLVVSGAASVLAEKKGPTEGGAEGSSKAQVLEMELQLAKEALASKLCCVCFF